MKLYEFEGMELFSRYGVPTPRFDVASSPEDARRIAESLGGRVVVKAQVLVGGRGKAGGVKVAESPEKAEQHARRILGMEIRGERVEKLVIAEAVDILKELYLSIILDRSIGAPLILASPEGGVDIEELARTRPEKIIKVPVDPFTGLRPYHIRRVAKFLELPSEAQKHVGRIISGLYKLFMDYDCELAEVNPLVLRGDGSLLAIDSKVIVDDNSLYRHPDLQERAGRGMNRYEAEAKRMGFSYVELEGNIGVICNGAGLTMATMDTVLVLGGRPANFLDIGGGARADRVEGAVSLLLSHPRVKILFINILGGITRCDEVAKGIVNALRKSDTGKRMVVRLKGTNEEEGRRILEENGIYTLEEMDEAARKAVELAEEVD